MKLVGVMHRFYPDGKQCWPSMVNGDVVWTGRPKDGDETLVDVPEIQMYAGPDGWHTRASFFPVDAEIELSPKLLSRRLKIPYETVSGRPRTKEELAADVAYWFETTAPNEVRVMLKYLMADRSAEAQLGCDACKDLPECVECTDE